MSKKNEEIETKQYTFKLNPAMVESINLFSQQMTQVAKSMQYMQKYLKETAKLIPSIVPPALPKYVLQLGDYLRRKDIAIPFTECGLWLTPSMTPSLVLLVIERYEQGKKRTIPAAIDGFYRQNNWRVLSDAVKRWESYEFFKPRMPIFYDALEAHIRKKWTLTIPALIPHIEGIAGEILLANKLSFTKDTIIVSTGQ
ncbi:hypothetical protein ACFLVF_00660, partial [Chloroflexota bacterium]